MVKLGSYVTWKMARFYESGREETDSAFQLWRNMARSFSCLRFGKFIVEIILGSNRFRTSSNSVLTFIGRFSFPNYVRSDDTKHFDIPMDPTAVFGCALPAEISNILATLQLQTNILRSSYTNILKFPAIADCFKGTNFSRLS